MLKIEIIRKNYKKIKNCLDKQRKTLYILYSKYTKYTIYTIYTKEFVVEDKEKKAKASQDDTFSAIEICKKFDITKNTLFKWEKDGKISRVEKDWRGWRIFSDENIDEIKNVIEEKMKKNR